MNIFDALGIKQIKEDVNYWFVRTQGGDYFDDFVADNYIGIEWEEIIPDNISNVKQEDILKMVVEKYPNESRPKYIANQINRFINEIKQGDIVLIPNKNSEIIAIGEVSEDKIYLDYSQDKYNIFDFFDETDGQETLPKLCKRRKVSWLKPIKRTELDPYLQLIVYSHNTIVNINHYANFVDRAMSDFYVKGNKAYFTYRINKENDINFMALSSMMNFNNLIIAFINKNINDNKLKEDMNNIVCKINVQSKGPVQISGAIAAIFLIGVVSTSLFGGHYKLDIEVVKLEFETPGVVEKVKELIEVINENPKEVQELREELKKCQEQLELTIPDTNTSPN